jgi:hypothetical protein
MAQKTNLNVSPYFDDFDSSKEYYKVLFSPGRPIQARELNNIQSQIQNQIEKFGSHIFKDGSMVIPGGVTYDSRFYAVKLDPRQFGIDINIYINSFIGKRIYGKTSGVGAEVDYIAYPSDSDEVEYITLYVKYIKSDNNNNIAQFSDGESLYCDEDVTYGNTTISSETPFATTIAINSTAIGSAAHVSRGVYFVRGYFVEVLPQTIILDYYSNLPSYKVGFTVNEKIVNAKEDNSLYDNAKGFTNFAAPGADRFSISLKLDKRPLDDVGDPNFIEYMRTDEGELKKEETTTQYSLIRDYLAKRTYDESGDYSVDPFTINLKESLNDYEGNDGLFFPGDTTDDGNIPSDDLACIKLSPGIAYVSGYDIAKQNSTSVDIQKPRTTERIDRISSQIKLGNFIRVNNVNGSPNFKETIGLYSARKTSNTAASGTKIGDARVYNCNLTDAAYTSAASSWDLYLYDIQTYTKITLNSALSNTELPESSFVKGVSSGASGYAVSAGGASTTVYLRQTSGIFQEGEKITINGVDEYSRTVTSVIVYSLQDVKSLFKETTGGLLSFSADTILYRRTLPGFTSSDEFILTSGGVVTCPGKFFSNKIKIGDVVSYIGDGDTQHYNVVSSISADLSSITLGTSTTVSGVSDGSIGVSADTKLKLYLKTAKIVDYNNGSLYVNLPKSNISSVDLSSSSLSFKSQTINQFSTGSGTFTVDSSNFNLSAGISTAFFESFDQERYSVHYTDRTIETLSSDKVALDTTQNQVTFNNVTSSKTVDTLIATLTKTGIQSKVKNYNRNTIVNYSLSKYKKSGNDSDSTISDGLTYSAVYGIRVQDEEICLGYPDVSNIVKIYESLDSDFPEFDQLTFSSLVNVSNNAIIGEKIVGSVSGAACRVVRKPNGLPNNLEIVYLNTERFSTGEVVRFEESEITTPIDTIINGEYKDITNRFILDQGQTDQYYNYSKLVRKSGESEPSRKITIIFNHYTVPSNDNGQVFTALSYSKNQYQKLIPRIGKRNILASNTLDFRPRVSPITNLSSLTRSPFDFTQRSFNSYEIIAPDEVIILGIEYYLGRIDKLFLNRNGQFVVKNGTPSLSPVTPPNEGEGMLLATIFLPPYLSETSHAIIKLESNKRYTMRDIGKIDTRLTNLERTTTLSLLEVNTEALQIKDADGLDQFKTGFFVDNFENNSYIDRYLSTIEVNKGISAFKNQNTLPNIPQSKRVGEIYYSQDGNIRFASRGSNLESLTLNYTEVDWIEQPIATRVENVNPFHVVEYVGTVSLSPSEDRWVRTFIKEPANVINKTINLENQIYQTETVVVQATGDPVFVEDVTRVRASAFDEMFGRQPNGDSWPNGTQRTISNSSSTSVSVNTVPGTPTDETFTTSDTASSTVRRLISVEDEKFMRSRNVEFSASNLMPFARHYQFLDSQSKLKYIPKIINVSKNASGSSFITGEIVDGYRVLSVSEGSLTGPTEENSIITFKLCTPNHKYGDFNNPTDVYITNPYDQDTTLPSKYSSGLNYLNIDTNSLANDINYSGYLSTYMKFVGRTSGAVAWLSRNDLISDANGDLQGCFFIEDPYSNPAPVVKFNTGTKTYQLTSSQTNEEPLPGSTDISRAETNYTATGILNTYQDETTNITTNLNTTVTTTVNTTTITTTTTTRRTVLERYDPLAQSFEVGRTSQAPQNTSTQLDKISDSDGAFLTAVDIYFRKVDSGNSPITIQVRSMELGTPTLIQIGEPVILRPNSVVPGNGGKKLKELVSQDASVPCHITFPYPIYLPPDDEYAIVLLAPQSIGYEVFIAEMNEKSLNEKSLTGLPEAEASKYSKQFAIGSLFKSQNGSIWTADQNQDLKFKLYKARFTTNAGTAIFNNPPLIAQATKNYFGPLVKDPIEIFPRKLTVGVTTTSKTSALFNSLTFGRKVTSNQKQYNYGFIEGLGGPSGGTIGITTGGFNYADTSAVDTYNVSGKGSGLRLNITTINGTITAASVSAGSSGSGYVSGDVIGIVTSSVSNSTGYGALLTVSDVNFYDTLYLTDVQGENLPVGSTLQYYDSGIQSSGLTILSCPEPTGIYAGNVMKVNQFAHGMYSTANKVTLAKVYTDKKSTKLSSQLISSSTLINVESTADLTTFEGRPVSGSNPGYVIIENEIIRYTGVSANSLTNITRGIDSSIVSTYEVGQRVYKYEVGGVSLRRINEVGLDVYQTLLEVADIKSDLDSYYVEFSRTTNGVNRSSDNTPVDAPQLSFNRNAKVGGNIVAAGTNLLYNEITPSYDVYAPGGGQVSVKAFARMVTGTSVDGTETSFLDLGYSPIQLNSRNVFNDVRMVASRANEISYLSELPDSRSFTTALNLQTTNPNLSPQIFIDNTVTDFGFYRLNKPVSDYITDGRVNNLIDGSHSATYVSSIIALEQPSTSLKVLISAYRDFSSDFRVLYNLVSADSFAVDQGFVLFPGYNNLTIDNNQDGFLDVVNPSLNSGLPDKLVRPSLDNEFLEYEYTASSLPEFVGFSIKIVMSGTNQAKPPIIKNIRVIALA